MPDLPEWLPIFLFVACTVLFVLIPARVLWKMRRDRSGQDRKSREFADRLKTNFSGVAFHRSTFTGGHVYFRYQERPHRASIPDPGELRLELDVDKLPHSPVVIRSNRGIRFPFAFEGWRFVGRTATGEKSIFLYGTASLGALYREMALHPDGTHINLPESVTVIAGLPGISGFEFRASKAGGFRLRLFLETDDLLYRPEHFESAVHHFNRLYEGLVLE